LITLTDSGGNSYLSVQSMCGKTTSCRPNNVCVSGGAIHIATRGCLLYGISLYYMCAVVHIPEELTLFLSVKNTTNPRSPNAFGT